MQQPQDLSDELFKALPGMLGAMLALRWVEGTPLQRATSFVGGAIASYYGAPFVARALSVDTGLAGFVVGLFGMACAAKIFETIAALNIAGMIERAFNRWWGDPPAPPPGA